MSLAVHLAAGLVVISHAGVSTGNASGDPRPAGIVTVHLDRGQETEPAPVAHNEVHDPTDIMRQEAAAPSTVVPRAAQDEFLIPLPRHADPPEPPAPEPHYFRSQELSERPRIEQDFVGAITFSGIPAQNVILRLFINEKGEVDRVAVEQSFLPEEMTQQLIDSFAKAKFQPGTVDRIPVKSQLKIEVRIEDKPLSPER